MKASCIDVRIVLDPSWMFSYFTITNATTAITHLLQAETCNGGDT